MTNTIPASLIAQLQALDLDQIKRIDAALVRVGDFGEVRLIKAKGRLRYIQKLDSEAIGDKFSPPE